MVRHVHIKRAPVLLKHSVVALLCRPVPMIADTIRKLGPLVAMGNYRIASMIRGQVEALKDQKQGGQNYFSEQQGWMPVSGV